MHGGLEPSDTAGLLGLPLGVAGIVIAGVALRKPIEGNDAELARGWAATLAKQVENGESPVWRQLLGDDTRRINLAYNLHPAAARPAMAPAAGRLTADGSGPVTLPDIVTFYRATQPLRLVITGAPGAGKTVLALELMLALLDGRAEDDPVPVRIPLSRWDTERQSLPELLCQRLVEAYDWPADLAAGLVRHGMVLPVLDGLDEMDPPALDGSPDPAAPRATAVVEALNTYQQGRDAGPFILTCRTHHYDALTAHTEVLDAARIAIAPVGSVDAQAYFTDRALGTVRWQPLLDHLAAHPGGFLATVLSTPWRLCLTATVYHRDGNPAELLTFPDADALDRHLLARYIPAATRTAPNPRGYTPQDV
ncbi:NACHT domain-containing protein, partial [Streptomyces sp. NPDC088357]|uniref:NACHT domain-containing protein n=1 Tax=Streptomyces sp. NPDC088357 TaxID=3154655 RepID=UPI0034413A0B